MYGAASGPAVTLVLRYTEGRATGAANLIGITRSGEIQPEPLTQGRQSSTTPTRSTKITIDAGQTRSAHQMWANPYPQPGSLRNRSSRVPSPFLPEYCPSIRGCPSDPPDGLCSSQQSRKNNNNQQLEVQRAEGSRPAGFPAPHHGVKRNGRSNRRGYRWDLQRLHSH